MIARLYARLWLDAVYRDRWLWPMAVLDVAVFVVWGRRLTCGSQAPMPDSTNRGCTPSPQIRLQGGPDQKRNHISKEPQ